MKQKIRKKRLALRAGDSADFGCFAVALGDVSTLRLKTVN